MDIWSVPAAATFLDEIENAHRFGLVIVRADHALPAGWDLAMNNRLRTNHLDVRVADPRPGVAPAKVLAESLDCLATVEAMVQPDFHSISVLADIKALEGRLREEWWTFLGRFWNERNRAGTGAALIMYGAHPAEKLPSSLTAISWGERVRRLDVALWSDMHAPGERAEPLATLASALALEVCSWRLDLVAEIVRASREDLIDPLSWLERREEQPIEGNRRFGSMQMACPIALVRRGEKAELERRIWRAQLSALFPWIEDLRQAVVARHRTRLRLNDHLRALGVSDVSEIELGALAWQLCPQISRDESIQLESLARIRNSLAHRRPASKEDLEIVLKSGRGA